MIHSAHRAFSGKSGAESETLVCSEWNQHLFSGHLWSGFRGAYPLSPRGTPARAKSAREIASSRLPLTPGHLTDRESLCNHQHMRQETLALLPGCKNRLGNHGVERFEHPFQPHSLLRAKGTLSPPATKWVRLRIPSIGITGTLTEKVLHL